MAKTMKILFISDLYPPNFQGGYELRCAETANEISSRGHNVFILTGRLESIDQPIIDNIYRELSLSPFYNSSHQNISQHPFSIKKRTNQIIWIFKRQKNYAITRAIAKALKPDIAFIWNMDYLDVSPIIAVQDLGIPTVYSLGAYWLLSLRRDIDLEPNPLKKIFRGMVTGLKDFRKLDIQHLIANSHSLKTSYIQGGFSEQDITVIPRGIPSRLIINAIQNDVGNLENKYKLLFVGRLTPDKAPDIAIKSVAQLVNEFGLLNVKLDIIGTGTNRFMNELKELISSLHLEQSIEFKGRYSHDDVLNIYLEYDCLLFPSRWNEPFGGTILEAMARGLPVVAMDCGGIPNLITNEKDGLLVPADEPESLANSIYRILKDPKFANRLRAAALKKVRNKYTLEKVTDQILEYFDAILNRK